MGLDWRLLLPQCKRTSVTSPVGEEEGMGSRAAEGTTTMCFVLPSLCAESVESEAWGSLAGEEVVSGSRIQGRVVCVLRSLRC